MAIYTEQHKGYRRQGSQKTGFSVNIGFQKCISGRKDLPSTSLKKSTPRVWENSLSEDISEQFNGKEKKIKMKEFKYSPENQIFVKNYQRELLKYLVFTKNKPTFSGMRYPASHLMPRSMFWPKLDSDLFLPSCPKFPKARTIIVKTPKLLESSPNGTEKLWHSYPKNEIFRESRKFYSSGHGFTRDDICVFRYDCKSSAR